MKSFYKVILTTAGIALVVGIIISIVMMSIFGVNIAGGVWSKYLHWDNGSFFENNNWGNNWSNNKSSNSLLKSNNYNKEDISKEFKTSKYGDVLEMNFTFMLGDVIISENDTNDTFTFNGENIIQNTMKDISVVDGVFRIEQDNDFNGNNWFDFEGIKQKIYITYPQDFIAENFTISHGSGNVNLNGLSTKNATLELGAGNFTAEDFEATSCIAKTGAGNTKFFDADISNFDLSHGVGNFKFEGELKGKSYISCGVGNITFNIDGDGDDYRVDTESGIGNISLHGVVEGSRSIPTKHSIYIAGGLGNVDVTIKDID